MARFYGRGRCPETRRPKILSTIVLVFTLTALLWASANLMLGVQATGATAFALAANRVVTSTADSGPGTLRQALTDSQNADTISFDSSVFSPASPGFIALTSGPLPSLTQGDLTINGGAGVVLDGSALTSGDGLHITSDGNSISGIRIINFPGSGVTILDGASFNAIAGCLFGNNRGAGVSITGIGTMSNTVKGSYVGISIDGVTSLPNEKGVSIDDGANYNVIGGTNPGDRNFVSGNTQLGIYIKDGSSYNTVQGNYIGVNREGTVAVGNGSDGVYVSVDTNHNLILNNLISGNAGQGVKLSRNARYNVVAGNKIGVDVTGTTAISNTYAGVRLDEGSKNNWIGGTNMTPGAGCSGDCNLISGNGTLGVGGGAGVWISNPDTTNNVVSGNFIGTDVGGNAALGNIFVGVAVSDGAHHNQIGGYSDGERNLISGNNSDGVWLNSAGTDFNTVAGNYIGVNVNGTGALGNGGFGVHLREGAQNNLIGGNSAQARNVISGNTNEGVSIRGSGTRNNVVSGNYIGTSVDGATVLGNGAGVSLVEGASYNLVGGVNATPGGNCTGECNVIAGNGWDGVAIRDAETMSNTVSGNYIGTDFSGSLALGNGPNDDGVGVRHGPMHNIIGGLTPARRNVICGHGDNGIKFDNASYNIAIGNFIGTNASGNEALGNLEDGVALQGGAHHNRIGGPTANERNLISGNGNNGIRIEGGSHENVVSGNYIGTDVTGTTAIRNADHGVRIAGDSTNNLIGGINATPSRVCGGACNLISGNGNDGWESGVWIEGTATMSNTVSGNYIGTDVNGTAILGNVGDGVRLDSGTKFNRIGGTTSGERNIISGNGRDGVEIGGVHNNWVSGNFIGTNADGSAALGNTERGIGLNDAGQGLATTYNVIHQNLISGNGCNGMDLYGPKSTDNAVTGNLIGTDQSGTLPLGNGCQGIFIGGQANGNRIGPDNTIAFNQNGIVVIDLGSVNNTITQNGIYSNTHKGINLVLGGNEEFFAPILTNVEAKSVQGIAAPNSTIEVFSDAEDEGRVYQGSTNADASGNFMYSQQLPFAGPNMTATATDGSGNTSEFSGGYAALTDVAVEVVFEPSTAGVLDQQVIPSVKISNRGTSIADDVAVKVEASGSALPSAYTRSITVRELSALSYRVLTFAGLTPTKLGTYTFEATVSTSGDQNGSNNSKSRTVTVGDARVDVWTRDNPNDSGNVPTTDWWQSPDIWVRNQDDGETIQIHQAPISGTVNYVYVRVRNRGIATATNTKVKVYWHEPSLGIACGDWAPIGEASIPSLPADGVQIVKVSWTPNRTGHTCLFDVLESAQDPVTNECDVSWDNNIEQRNVDIIASIPLQGANATTVGVIDFAVGNVYGQAKLVDLIIDRSDVPAGSDLRLDLGSNLYSRWKSVNGDVALEGAVDVGGGVLSITAPMTATVKALPLAADESLPLKMTLTAAQDASARVTIYARIDGNVIGGNTYQTATYSPEHDIFLPAVVR